MRRYKYGAMLATPLLVAGCAATAPEAEVGVGPMPVTVSAPQSGAPADETLTTPTASPDAAAIATVAAVRAETSPDLVIDLNQQPPTTYSEVVCRQMLKPNSNVVVNRCMTRPDWKIYDREEARWAADTLLKMQGLFR